LWRAEYDWVCQERLEVFEEQYQSAQNYNPATMVQYLDFKSYLPYDILAKVDVASMMHGLEVRTPIVDVRVVELASQIPEGFNIARNSSGEWSGKLLLKDAMRRYYPDHFLERPKMGFSVPVSIWFGKGGGSQESLHYRLLGHNSKLYELFEPATIKNMVKRNFSGRNLWLLLFLEEWLEQNNHLPICG